MPSLQGDYFGALVFIEENKIQWWHQKKMIKESKLGFKITKEHYPTMSMHYEGNKVKMIFTPPFNAIAESDFVIKHNKIISALLTDLS